ncbi:MAG: cytochrome ubiquinol oxidase subunit I [Planctomycetota bacterium]
MIFLAAAQNPFLQFPGGAKFAIGFLALFHTSVGSLAIGFAFVVTILQLVGYVRRDNQFDRMAKRIQLWHVCIYNIGTINAIGLVFALSGLYPQFWSQIFVQFFWTLIIEEALFFMLALTLTFHYFFWDDLWGHKKLHIFLGALLTPMFFLQFAIINGMSAYMLTPGFSEGQVSQWSGTAGILGWDKLAFYNPTFLMLTLHRAAANFAYAGFIVAAICGFEIYRAKHEKILSWNERGGRLSFKIAIISFLSLPIVGFFYAWVLKYHGKEAYENLMIGRGDVVAGGIDWWWVKHLIVATMIGMGLMFCYRAAKYRREFRVPMTAVYALSFVYLMFYVGMGAQMTWKFFWVSLAAAVFGGMLCIHLLNFHEGSGRAVFLLMGILSFFTVILGGYAREASRPRFVSPSGERLKGFNRIADYDNIYRSEERAGNVSMAMLRGDPDYIEEVRGRPQQLTIQPETPEDLISSRCISCHTLQRAFRPQGSEEKWDRVVGRMHAYGTRLTPQEKKIVVQHIWEKEQVEKAIPADPGGMQ